MAKKKFYKTALTALKAASKRKDVNLELLESIRSQYEKGIRVFSFPMKKGTAKMDDATRKALKGVGFVVTPGDRKPPFNTTDIIRW